MSKKLLSTKDLQKIELEILCFIRDLCNKEKIAYYIAGGTALGAVRHKGFIPWDDDIDIVMFRDDYNRFRNVMINLNDSRYKLMFIDTDSKYSLPLPKVIDTRTILHQMYQREIIPLGVYVDIFILDNAPESEKERERFVSSQKRIASLWAAAQNKGDVHCKSIENFVKQSVRRLLWMIGPRHYATMLNRRAQKYNLSETSLCGSFVYSTAFGKTVFPKNMFGHGLEIEFEGEMFMAPERIHDYLIHDFGNYMELPSPDKRVSIHDFEAYYKEN